MAKFGAPGILLALVLSVACTATNAAQARVMTGIDVLVRDGFQQLSGARVGLITNHTGVDGEGHSTIRRLHIARNVDLVRIFSPEHGIEGKLDTAIDDHGAETATGTPIFSLYGEVRRPTPEMLREIDTLVFDIQDIGTRFYTYVSTMGNAMLAAAEHGIRFVVLDRPNPINGVTVAGPVLDEGKQSFVGFHRIAVRHGMTVGELAQMLATELNLDLDLQVIQMRGWHRSDYFDQTGLPWVNPSPNMRNLEAALLYPGIGLLETTNVSVGRGTESPFQIIGAPWLDGPSLATGLNNLGLPGVGFTATRFTPESSTFAGIACNGIKIVITNRARLDSVHLGFEIARLLVKLYPQTWQVDSYLRLLGNEQTLAAIKAGHGSDRIETAYAEDLQLFLRRRSRYLLYD